MEVLRRCRRRIEDLDLQVEEGVEETVGMEVEVVAVVDTVAETEEGHLTT